MNHQHGEDAKRAGLPIRSPFAVLGLMPVQLPLMLSLVVVSIVFTIWPKALEHTPVSFETRGIIHHVWHYSLLVGSVLALVGMFWTSGKHLKVELAGLFILMGSMAMNLIALVATIPSANAGVGEGDVPSGLGLALRFGILVGLGSRAYIVVVAPTVRVAPPVAIKTPPSPRGG